MVIEEKILTQLADEHSRKILQLTMEKPKTAERISSELGIPLSTVYRKIKELKEAGLLVVEKSAVTKTGKVCDLYRRTINCVKVRLDKEPPSLEITFNEDVYNKISRVWRALREAR